MASSTPKIEMRGVKKRFGPKVVLDGIDLTLNQGESLVVIGGSGTGKSVMIKCVLGILRPEEGRILVDGKDVTRSDRLPGLSRTPSCTGWECALLLAPVYPIHCF